MLIDGSQTSHFPEFRPNPPIASAPYSQAWLTANPVFPAKFSCTLRNHETHAQENQDVPVDRAGSSLFHRLSCSVEHRA